MIVTIILILTLSIFAIYSIKLISLGYSYGFLLLIISAISIYFVLNPKLTGILANYLGVGRGADLLLYLSFCVGIILILALSIKIRNLNKCITDLARYIAINMVSKK